MTSTTAPVLGTDTLPLGLADASVPTEPDGRAGSRSMRRRSRFPGPAGTSGISGDEGPIQVRWMGADGPLREHVRDHSTAIGMELTDIAAEEKVACVITDATSLSPAALSVTGGRAPLLVVTTDADIPTALWQRALRVGARAVIPLPSGSEELLSQLAELARPRGASTVIAVAGGCGGAGASSFAARLAAAARLRGPVVLVDADPLGGGLDLLVEESGNTGIGWEDATALGPDDGEALREGLPLVDDVRLLVSRDHTGPDPQAVSRALSALSPLRGTVIVDLADAMVPAAAEHADHLLLVVPATDHAVRAATRRLRTWHLPDDLAQAAVRRRGPLTATEVSQDLELPLAAAFRDSPRGTVPLLDVRRRGADRAARRLIARLSEQVRS